MVHLMKPQFRGNPPRFIGYSTGERMPTFTKRHYEVVTKAIAEARRQHTLSFVDRQHYELGISAVANELAEAFKRDNSRFDIFAFVTECTRSIPNGGAEAKAVLPNTSVQGKSSP